MLQRLTMQKKLIGALTIVSVIAIAAIGWLTFQTVTEGRASATAANEAAEVVELSVIAGDLVHELQIERGMTVGFVASGGANFASELPGQRSDVDDALSVLRAFLGEEGRGLDGEVTRPVEGALDTLGNLDGLRASASALQADGPEVASYYTGAISRILDGVESGFAGVTNAELLREGAAYTALGAAKEAAGLQRAQLNAVFTADEFTTAQLRAVGGLVGEQQATLHSFEVYASEQAVDAYRQRAGSSPFAVVAAMETTAFERAFEGGFGITPQEWFDASTARIDLLREVELVQAEHMQARAEQIASQASRSVAVDSALSVGSLLVLVALVVAVIVWLRRRVIAPLTSNAQTLATSSEDMSAVAAQVGSNSEETAAQAGVVASAGEQVSQNVQAVATAVDELTSSISEIAQNASETTEAANVAVGAARSTNETISKLGESSAEIGKVIELINTIAEQTNLLSLNATIEAARAGEAGKGFAVVAHEVKELAKETANATDEVGKRISAIQDDTGKAVAAIQQISEIVERISNLQTTIASAVEEQSSATNEIARSVNEAAQGASEIAENITSVASAARDTTEGASRTQQAAAELKRMAEELDALVFGDQGPAHAPAPSLNGQPQQPVFEQRAPQPEPDSDAHAPDPAGHNGHASGHGEDHARDLIRSG